MLILGLYHLMVWGFIRTLRSRSTKRTSLVRMKSALLFANIFVLPNLFMVAYSGVYYPAGCPVIKPLTGLTADQLTGQFHDARQTSTTPYYDAYYCNYVNASNELVTKFTATMKATGETYKTDILWILRSNEETPVGNYADVYFGYYEPQELWFLGHDSDSERGYYCVYSCTENKDGSFSYIFQYEPRGCEMTDYHQKNLDKILKDNNLDKVLDLQAGWTDKCVEDLKCPPEFEYV